MSEFARDAAAETEKGFGTGLRAQLERRRETTSGGKDSASKGEQSAQKPAAGLGDAAPTVDLSTADVEALRAELAMSLAREQDLRGALSEQVAAYDHDSTPSQEVAERAAELDQRAGRLSAHEAALEERERNLAERLEAVEVDRRRLADAEQELAAQQARTKEREQHVAAKLRELTTADDERLKAAGELSKQATAIAAREKKVEKAEAAFESRQREEAARAIASAVDSP